MVCLHMMLVHVWEWFLRTQTHPTFVWHVHDLAHRRSSDATTAGAAVSAAEGGEDGWECDLMKHVLQMHHDVPQVVQSILQDIICCITAGCEDGVAGELDVVWSAQTASTVVLVLSCGEASVMLKDYDVWS